MKIEVNLEKRYAYLIIGLLILVFGFFVVNAYGTSNPAVFGHSAGELEIAWDDITDKPYGLPNEADAVKVMATTDIATISAVVAGAFCLSRQTTNYGVYTARRDFGSGTCQSACQAVAGGNALGDGLGDARCTGLVTDPDDGEIISISGRPGSYYEADTQYCDWCCCVWN